MEYIKPQRQEQNYTPVGFVDGAVTSFSAVVVL